MLQILLHTKDPSNRLYVLVLELESYTFFKIKISSPQEIIKRSIERKYKSPLKNAYMIFMTDCSEAFKAAKSEKKFRQNSERFKDFSLLWSNSPKEIKDEYDQIYKFLKRNDSIQFVHYSPQNGNNEPMTNSQISQPTVDNDANISISEATACEDNAGNLFIDSLEGNNTNNLLNYSIVDSTGNLIGSLGNNTNNYSLVDNTRNIINSFGGNNANNLSNYSIVDNTGNLTETLGPLESNNTNNLSNYPIINNTGNLISPFRGNDTNNLNNYPVVDNAGNLIGSFGGNHTNDLDDYSIVDTTENLINPFVVNNTNDLDNYSIVDNTGNLINPFGESHTNNLNNYQIVNTTGDLFISENPLGSLGGNNVIIEAGNSLNNYQIVSNAGDLIIGTIEDCLFEQGQDEIII